eukprot:CAMPEP_0172811320 /NCGR_PEP_ID=MMETSP1075-20121228/9344_1 /TAXON_ID=2916 /ORGANISM="Ceratium fusus, Strain PA161109" /LENGTH=172 /DNA_ID=CAMNT_0013650731 /DNA_START=72 /DNA_END=591 /DNA_ORIENTATION=+
MFRTCCCADDGTGPKVCRVLHNGEETGDIFTSDAEQLHGYSAVNAMTPREREVEVMRLQALVTDFLKQVTRGMPCTYVRDDGLASDMIQTKYRIPKGIVDLEVVSPDDVKKAEVTCPLALIQDIFTFIEDGHAVFGDELVSQVESAGLEKELLLMIVYAPKPAMIIKLLVVY